MRANAIYHSPACRMRARRAENAHKTRTRRQSRDGYGTRVYLTSDEICDLRWLCGDFHAMPNIEAVSAKLGAAADRIQAKEKGGPRGSIRRGAA